MSTLAHRARGVLVAFEGIDGSGKTTQAHAACATLCAAGLDALYLREPTDGPYGTKLRELMVAGRENVSPMQEFELFLRDREEDVRLNIQPALDRGVVVCLDRYYISSMAYQGALGLDPAFIRAENEKIAPVPDLILYFRVPVHEGGRRIRETRAGGQNLFERQSYQERVAQVFDEMDFPQMVAIEAHHPVEQVHLQVMHEIERVLHLRGHAPCSPNHSAGPEQ